MFAPASVDLISAKSASENELTRQRKDNAAVVTACTPGGALPWRGQP